MLNSHWPSFLGHLIDYYLKPGGTYFGAKKGLSPVNIVYDYYASGDRTKAKIFVVNQTLAPLSDVQASVTLLDLDGNVKFATKAAGVKVLRNSSVAALEIPRVKEIGTVFFVRCQLRSRDGRLIAENVYWSSNKDDELGPPEKENAFDATLVRWADLTALNNMKAARLSVTGNAKQADGWLTATLTLKNESNVPAFFVRTEIVNNPDGDEILPVTWSDNYVTVFGGESITMEARYRAADAVGSAWMVRIQGHNVPMITATLDNSVLATATRQ